MVSILSVVPCALMSHHLKAVLWVSPWRLEVLYQVARSWQGHTGTIWGLRTLAWGIVLTRNFTQLKDLDMRCWSPQNCIQLDLDIRCCAHQKLHPTQDLDIGVQLVRNYTQLTSICNNCKGRTRWKLAWEQDPFNQVTYLTLWVLWVLMRHFESCSVKP